MTSGYGTMYFYIVDNSDYNGKVKCTNQLLVSHILNFDNFSEVQKRVMLANQLQQNNKPEYSQKYPDSFLLEALIISIYYSKNVYC